MDAEKGTQVAQWDGYCSYCGGLGHRPANCRWNGVRLARVAA